MAIDTESKCPKLVGVKEAKNGKVFPSEKCENRNYYCQILAISTVTQWNLFDNLVLCLNSFYRGTKQKSSLEQFTWKYLYKYLY